MPHEFLLFSLFYPLNLYIFEFILTPKTELSNLKVKITSILVSTSILWIYLNEQFNFKWNWTILKWAVIGLASFVLPLMRSKMEVDESPEKLLFWRNFVIAPACEEIYFRILLTKFCQSKFKLSLSFSLAHAHPLLFKSNWNKFKMILVQCAISFAFGFVNNFLRSKMQQEGEEAVCNFWVWIALSGIHGVANFCGLPIIEKENKMLHYFQLLILSLSIYTILK